MYCKYLERMSVIFLLQEYQLLSQYYVLWFLWIYSITFSVFKEMAGYFSFHRVSKDHFLKCGGFLTLVIYVDFEQHLWLKGLLLQANSCMCHAYSPLAFIYCAYLQKCYF